MVLDQNINQGAGGLFFKGDYTVKGANSDITWLGAGIDVADGKKVVWQVKNPQGDKLAKIGKGALEINGTGVNQGELKVGDGTVILNQKADSNQKVQAFSQVGIVSGRGTLVLNSPDQINPNNLYFGFRGGRLDANGNDLTFEHIRNVDEGARVVNHNTSNASTITLTGKSLITDPKGLSIHYIQNNDYDDDGYYGYYYRPRKPIPQGKDLYFKNYRYYALKPGGSVNSPMPENGVAENNDWVFMGYTEEKAKKNVMNHKNNQRISGFSGFFGEENGKGHNGALNLNFNGKSAQNRFLLTGGTNLNGKISVTQGNVLLSGRPTPHARDFVNKSSAYKDAHFSKNNEVVFEDDWINRTFKAAEITVNQSASLSSGRNVSNITANITATDNAKVNLGYKNGDEVCVRSDYTGYVTCTKDNLSDKALNSFDATQINGNVNLSQNAALTLGKAALWGQIQGQGNSRVSLNQHSKWHLTGDSQVQNLSLEDSHIHLNNASDAQSANKYHTLKINHLSGNGHFHYLTHLAKNLGDKVVVKESASGHYQLHVQDKTGEPNQEGLDLFDASSVQDRSRLSVSLANHHVDLGALRYTIKTENGITRLYNPYAENRRRVKPVPSPATNTASQAQKATQTDGAQIAKPQNIVIAPPSPQANQAEEAKRQQAEAEKVARRKAEEAKRQAAELLAKQKAEAEAQALAARRQAEAERKARELAEREKAEAERKAAELAKQKAEQAKAQPKRRRRRAAPQNNVAIAQAQEARRQQAEAERVARLKAEEAKRQSEMLARQKSEEERKARELAEREKAEAEKVARRKAEEAKRQAAELLAKQKAEAEAQALAARRQAEAERKARELAEREKAEAERKAAELAKQKAEQAKAQPKRRRRRAAPQNNVAIAQAQEARRQQAEAERVARLKAEEAKRQSEMLARQKSEEERKARELAEREKAEAEKVARRKAEEAKRQAAELLAKQKAEAEAQALAARRQAEAERKARELAEREKAEAERKAAELAKQKAEQAKAQPKRRRRRAAPQNNVAIAQAQEARRQQAEAERVARLKAEEAKRQSEMLARQKSEEERKARELAEREKAEAEKVARRKAEEAKRQAAELLAKQKAEAEAQALAARRQAEAERKARELAEREKAEAERKAAELAKQKAEQAKAQPKRRRRRAAPQNNVAIAQAQEARRQQAEAERVARLKAEEAKRQSEMLARQKSEEERKARELAEREKAEAERKAEELAKQKAEEASHQAKVQPKRRRRRAILPRPPAPVFSLDDYDAKDNSESSIGNLARVTPRMKRELIDDFEEIPLSALEEAETTTNITDNIGKDIQEILDDEFENTDIEPLIDSLGQVVRLQPRTLSPMENMSQAQAISKNTNTALSDAMVSSQFILLDTGSSLVQQITQTELSANKENNVWVSNTTYDRHYSSTQYRQFSAKRSQIQIGIDHYLSKNTQVGTVLSYVRNSNVFDQASGKNTFVQANTYGKYYFDYGWYISGDIGVGQLRSQLQTQQKAKFNRIATQAGITMGNRIDINRFEILPSIGVRYSYLSPIDYKLDSDSLKVDRISIKTALAKLDLAYQFNIGEFSLKPILSMVYVINSGEGIVNIGGQNYRYKSDNQQQYSAGMALNYRSLTFNINGGAIKGRQLSNQKFLQIKMQVSF
ncbi:immunoglobulin A1 protease family protein [Haemophilus influenzae]|nr:autotransporter beta-domain protein [Haemophilus influenzae]WCO84998.1 immunoglobulin A1 protease family protein [Haemophilus influenzae]